MATQKLLKLSKEQRKSLYRWWWNHYNDIHHTGAHKENPDNPNQYSLIRITQNWFLDQDYPVLDDENTLPLIEKYRPKFVLWAQRRVKANGGWPKEQNRTKVVKEFLARGFIHQSDAPYTPGAYPVVTLIGELQWPVSFELHQEALEVSKKFGIPGYTKCPLPKQK